MNDIAQIPYVDATFDKQGARTSSVTLPAGVTDVFVVSHGWNNNADDAHALYRQLFENFVAVAQPNDLPGRRFAIVGVIWPAKEFDETVTASGVPGTAQGAASLRAADTQSQAALEAKIERMKRFFSEAKDRRLLDEAKALVPDLEDKGSARREFVNKIRSLVDRNAASKEDASDTFFKDDGAELMDRLKVPPDDLGDDVAGPGGTAALPLGTGAPARTEGGAAGLAELLSGFKAAAMNVLNFTTYFEMKARAGTVGKNGVGPLLDELAQRVERIHLVGHSFGGRLVTAAAASSTTDKIKSMSLLQTAFSHNGFSQSKHGFFRSVVDGQRVKGPILVTHTKNDKAVGVAYPLASRISGDTTAALGDEHDEYGGLGRNGAQQMPAGETVVGRLLAVGGSYAFQPGKFFNLEASQFITGHSDVKGREVAQAIRKAIA